MQAELVAKRKVGVVERRDLQLVRPRLRTHAPEVRPDRPARPAAPRRARRARPGTRVAATTSRGFRSLARPAASRASRRRWVLLTAGPADASVARATIANSWSKVPTVAPITTSPSRVSSSSKRSTSSTVGTTSTGSRLAAVLNASSVFSRSARVGGPDDQFHAMRPSIGRDSALDARVLRGLSRGATRFLEPRTAWFCA